MQGPNKGGSLSVGTSEGSIHELPVSTPAKGGGSPNMRCVTTLSPVPPLRKAESIRVSPHPRAKSPGSRFPAILEKRFRESAWDSETQQPFALQR